MANVGGVWGVGVMRNLVVELRDLGRPSTTDVNDA